MVVNKLSKLFVTKDAATIIRELEIVHPAAKLISMASSQQEDECGDGTNFVLMLSGELLKKAEELLKMGIHSSEIVLGYEKAYQHTIEILESLVIDRIDLTRDQLFRTIKSVVCTKHYGYETFLTGMVVDAALHVMPENALHFNVDSIRVVKVLGSGLLSSHLVPGMVFGRQPDSSLKHAINAKIGIFSCPLDIGRTETKGTVLLQNSKQLLEFSKGEEHLLESQLVAISDSGVRVLVTGGTIGELALHFINRLGLVALKVSSKFDLLRLCKVVGATALARLGPPTPEEMGFCNVVETIEIGSDRCTVFRQENRATRTATIVLRGSTMNYLDDVERAIDDGINAIKSLTKDNRVLPGAGATEVELSRLLMEIASKDPGISQHAMVKYAEALEIVPRSLSENAGLDPEVVVSGLYAQHQIGNAHSGVNLEGTIPLNSVDHEIFDIYSSKSSGMYLATDATVSILKVDSIVMSNPASGPAPSRQRDED